MSLEGPYDTDNIFAKILRGEVGCVNVFEDDKVLSFMDLFPQSRGHTLVIPKAPSRTLFDTDADVLSAVIQRTQYIAKAVKAALAPSGIRLVQFNGAAAGQTVFHLHFHILPCYGDTDIAPHIGEAGRSHMADMTELEALATQIKAKL